MWPGIVSVLIFPALGVNELDVRPLFLPIRLAELSEEPVERRLSGLPVYFFLPRKSKGEPQIPHPEIAVEHSGEFLYGVRLVAFDFFNTRLFRLCSPPNALAASLCRHPAAADLRHRSRNDLVLHVSRHSFYPPS